ncbi:MAG TPA: hypothetical protein VGV10_04125 [Thermoleophilaceae bacterium]|nr:hypothetical protein [Thermoleophilaceae bacterium]
MTIRVGGVRMRRLPLVCFAVALAAAPAACGEDREGSVEQSGGGTTTTGTTGTTGTTSTSATTAPRGPASSTVKVKETEYRIDPANPRIAKAGVVRFDVQNAGKVTHALEVEGPRGEVETEPIAPGFSVTLKADLSRPGTYKWYCPIADHEERGMTGKVAVAGGGSRTRSDDSGAPDDSRDGGSGSGKGPESSGNSGKRPGGYGGRSSGVH